MSQLNYIGLESVGSIVTEQGIVFPTDLSEAPETASDAEEMMGVHIMDTTNEWWESMSCQDAVRLFPFLANHCTELYNTEGYLQWAMEMGDLVVEANNQMSLYGASIEEGWDWSEAVDGWRQLPSQNILGGTI
jgi:hypothetical protein